ncbi:hypothetical protein C8R42DRAFT_688835, partial [Lentinula raphanica]
MRFSVVYPMAIVVLGLVCTVDSIPAPVIEPRAKGLYRGPDYGDPGHPAEPGSLSPWQEAGNRQDADSEDKDPSRDGYTVSFMKVLMKDIQEHPGKKIEAGIYPPDGSPPKPLRDIPTAEDPRHLLWDFCTQQNPGSTYDFGQHLLFDEKTTVTYNIASYPEPLLAWIATPTKFFVVFLSKEREGVYVIGRLISPRLLDPGRDRDSQISRLVIEMKNTKLKDQASMVRQLQSVRKRYQKYHYGGSAS